MKVAVIVQARMGSNRLPGKVLLPLGKISVLEHVLTRCKAIIDVDEVCCTMPDTEDSIPIAVVAEKLGVQVFKGSKHDVLGRYYGAAQAVNAAIVLRVTADCPMIDPEVCGNVLALVRGGGVEFACNNMPPTWPHGLDCEAVTFASLERAYLESDRAYEREHVTPWIRNHPNILKATLIGPANGSEGHRWTIDNQSDYDFLQAIWKRLPSGCGSWSYRVPLKILQAEPDLAEINKGPDRLEGLKKSMMEELA